MSEQTPLKESDIIFPAAHTSIHTALTQLKRNNLSIKNRLRSIAKDAEFVTQVQEHFGLPLIANERCGSWYIETDEKAGSAYFKSTDGHTGEWAFSLRRLNLHLLDIIGDNAGCIIVDSTRRGKSMPDALSKTVPIWIAVLNKIIFPDVSTELQIPVTVVSPSEHAQISSRIDHFVSQALTLQVDTAGLKQKLRHPMHAYWITPDMSMSDVVLSGQSYPVILCTASGQASTLQTDEPDYVQGAADDHESWACGLDPVSFWCEKERLLTTNEDELPSMIQEILSTRRPRHRGLSRTLIAPTSQVSIADQAGASSLVWESEVVVHCSPTPDAELQQTIKSKGGQYLHLDCMDGKIGSRQLRHKLERLDHVGESLREGHSILCVCPTGRDLAVGVALALVCRYFSDDGSCREVPQMSNKEEIKRRLSWIMVSMPDAAPSRATLQSVNAYLMS